MSKNIWQGLMTYDVFDACFVCVSVVFFFGLPSFLDGLRWVGGKFWEKGKVRFQISLTRGHLGGVTACYLRS